MEFITMTVLSGFVYDMIKHGAQLTALNLKSALKNWALDDNIAAAMAVELNALQLSDQMSEKAIEQTLTNTASLVNLLQQIQPNPGRTVNQTHLGSGDNVAGDKHVNA
jgi:Het-E N-terminal domain